MAEQERQTTAIDPTKLNYLGRGVDCREPRKTWLETLDTLRTDKIRDLAPNNGNIEENQVKSSERVSSNETTESKKGVQGSAKVPLCKGPNLGLELKVKRDTSTTTKSRTESRSTKIITMCKDTSQDPNIISRDGKPPTHYTKYEIELSQFILEHFETIQTEASSKEEELTRLGKTIKDLEGEDPVARLQDYLQHAKSLKEEICQQIQQTLANTCCSFINKEKPYTHYARSITLGAILQESYESQDSNCDISGGARASMPDVIDGSLQGSYQVVNKSVITRKESRGHIDFDSGNVTAEEVIEASMEPVSNLINKKSRELKVIMEWLLKCYSHTNRGVLQGPFRISCKKQLSLGREHEIFWQVIGDEIYGTTSASEASTFYIQCSDEKFCHIIHKTSKLQTELFVTVQRPFDHHLPLKLVPSVDQQDISFILMNKTKQSVDVPQTEVAWKRGSPFFVKLPTGGIPFLGAINKPRRYISIRYTTEKDKKTESSDTDSQEKEPKLTSVSNATSDIKEGDEAKETRELHDEKPKYTTGSSATPDMKDGCVISKQFYFTPVENVLGSSVTLSGPPPPPSRIESDSASDQNELERQQEDDDLKQAFIELVGREYVFPLQVKAAAISDTKSQ